MRNRLTKEENDKLRESFKRTDFIEEPTEDQLRKLQALAERMAKMAMEGKVELEAHKIDVLKQNNGSLKKDMTINRNDECPCGSGKKYKNCCMKSRKYETYTKETNK